MNFDREELMRIGAHRAFAVDANSIHSTKIRDLKNLGPFIEQLLASAGIVSADELAALGSVEAFVAIKRASGMPPLTLLWALEGALTRRHWISIEQTERSHLLAELRSAERTPTRSNHPGRRGIRRRSTGRGPAGRKSAVRAHAVHHGVM